MKKSIIGLGLFGVFLIGGTFYLYRENKKLTERNRLRNKNIKELMVDISDKDKMLKGKELAEQKLGELDKKLKNLEMEKEAQLDKLAQEDFRDISSEKKGDEETPSITIDEKILEKEQQILKLRETIEKINEDLAYQKAEHEAQEKLIKELRSNLKDKDIIIQSLRGSTSISLPTKIIFPSGRSQLNEKGLQVMASLTKTIKKMKNRKIKIVGHTDKIPIGNKLKSKYPTNWELSAFRAASVAKYLQGLAWIDPKNVEISGNSFYRPVAGNDTRSGREKNRRVEILILPKMQNLSYY